MKIFVYILVINLLICTVAKSQSVVANFNFNGATSYPVAASSTASNITCSLTCTEAFYTFSGTASGNQAFTSNATAGDAVALNNSSGTNTKYWTATLGGSDMQNYKAYRLYLQARRSTTGAQQVTLYYSTDGTTYTSFSFLSLPANDVFYEGVFDFSNISALDFQGAVYFKIAASGASGGGTLRVDNLQIQALKVENGNSGAYNWQIAGNTNTDENTNYFGTTDNHPVVVKTNGTEHFRFNTNGTADVKSQGNTLTLDAGNAQVTSSTGSLSLGSNNLTTTGSVGIGKSPSTGIILDINGDCHLNEHTLYFRNSHHGLAFKDTFGGIDDINGPVLFGWTGGALGAYFFNNTGAYEKVALRWAWNEVTSKNNIYMPGLQPSTTTEMLVIGTDGKLGTQEIPGCGEIYCNEGNVGIGTVPPSGSDAKLHLGGDVVMNGNSIYLKGSTDKNHGLSYQSTFGGVSNLDGPVLHGPNGGVLGIVLDQGAIQNIALRWNNSNEIFLPGIKPLTNTEMVIIGTDGKLGTQEMPGCGVIQCDDGQISVTSHLLYLRNHHHGLGWYGKDDLLNIDRQFDGDYVNGPVLFGYEGGALGSVTIVGGNDVEKMALRWNEAGNVGIGTANPLSKLHIKDGYGAIILEASAGRPCTDISFRKDGGTPNDRLWDIRAHTADVDAPFVHDLQFDGHGLGGDFVIVNAKVGIGTSCPDYALTVQGTVKASTEFVVENTGGWCDYVFEESYKPMSLGEIENYIKANKHLPEIPSAAEVEQDGVKLLDMNKKLLKKVEELTLFIIDLEKRIKGLEINAATK